MMNLLHLHPSQFHENSPQAWRSLKIPKTTITLFSNRPQGILIFHRSHCHHCSFKIINITRWARGVKYELSLLSARHYYSFQVHLNASPRWNTPQHWKRRNEEKISKKWKTLTGIEHKFYRAAEKTCRNVRQLKAVKQSLEIPQRALESEGNLSTLLDSLLNSPVCLLCLLCVMKTCTHMINSLMFE
jgi:hypothetical protein